MLTVKEHLQCQTSHIRLKSYENEFKTMQELMSDDSFDLRRRNCMMWYQMSRVNTAANFNQTAMAQKSSILRDNGNAAFNEKGKKRNLLAACRSYTEAIFAAPGGSEALALAHANRAMALQEFGYFQQAYDDCECALQQGYPKRLMHKILARQAHCSWKLQDVDRLKLHLEMLHQLPLNASFTIQINALKAGMHKLEMSPKPEVLHEPSPYELKQTIVETRGPRGSYMVAARKIKAQEPVFGDRARSFVPIGKKIICQNCAATQLIPFPCYSCKVIYCSLNCRIADAATHAYECKGYQLKLFAQVGGAHLALRTVLDNLPKVLPLLLHKRTAREIWTELTAQNSILVQQQADYLQTLRLITHLKEMTLLDILWFALMADLLLVYLKECTTFFDLMQDAKASHRDWELVTGSLLLLHIGQMSVNASSIFTISHVEKSDSLLYMLSDNLWARPYHVMCGQLHFFNYYEEMAAAYFPYSSKANHSCQQSFQSICTGRQMYTIAIRDIEKGEEIFNSFVPDYRKSKRSCRQRELKDRYKFVCQCQKCSRANPDEDYERFHRYRCENQKCRNIYVPNLPHLSSLEWWYATDDDVSISTLRCPHCGYEQNFALYKEFERLLAFTNKDKFIYQQLYKILDDLDGTLIEHNELKVFLAYRLTKESFKALEAGCSFQKDDFVKIVRVIKMYLNATAAQNFIKSIEYVSFMTYLWDCIALGYYKCDKEELDKMLSAIEVVSDEFKVIFMNYYEDFIKPNLKF